MDSNTLDTLFSLVSSNPWVLFGLVVLVGLGRGNAMRSRSGDRLNLKFGSSIQFNTRTQTETKILEVDDPEQFEELKQMLKQGQKVSAIKRFREITGADLTSAKMAMDHLAQALREGRL